MTEEVDEFLLEAPGMASMRNVRFTKLDTCEKAEPTSFVAVTGGANHSVDAYGMWTKDNDVSIVANNEVLVSLDSGDTWDVYAQDTDLLGIEKVCSTIEGSGAINFQMQPLGTYVASPLSFDITHYACAWERVRQTSQAVDNFRDVVTAIYDADGRLLSEKVIASASSPRLQPLGGTSCALLCVDIFGDFHLEVGSSITEAFTFVNTYARTIRDYNHYYNSTNFGWGAAGFELDGENMRLGYSVDMMDNNHSTAFHSPLNASFGVVGFKAGGAIEWERTALGIPQGSPQILTVDSDPLYYALLDAHTDGTYNYFLIAEQDTTTWALGTRVGLFREVVAGGTPDIYWFATNLNGPVVNGSIHLDNGGDDMYVAFTMAYGDPEQLMQTTLGRHALLLRKMSGVTGSFPPSLDTSQELFSQRLVSNIVVDKNDFPHLVVQQWDNWNPDDGAISASPDIPALTSTHQKPLTSVHLRWDYIDEEVDVIASYDAGQSKAMPASIEEQNNALMSMVYFDQGIAEAGAHQFWFGNRNLLTAEDNFYFLTNGTANAWPINDGRVPLHPGTARMNIYHLQSSLRVPYEQFSTGMFVGTSLPVWYDGSRELVESTSLESPEVCGLTMDGDGGTYLAYQELGIAADASKACQAVCGYYDDGGLVHRSAPSAPLYFGRAEATITTGHKVVAYVTPPLSVARNRQYFIEMYENFPGETPQLCATRWVSDNQASERQDVAWATNLNPTTLAHDLNVTGFRTAKALYTAGNVLAADPWPSFDLLAKSGRRIFAHSIGDPSAIFYSKTFENGIAPEFSAALVISLGNETITALAAIDDKVIAWTHDEMFLIYGTGPDNTGANGDFFVEKFPHKMGCIDQDSILQYADGIAFFSNSTREFQLVTRDLQIQDLGESVKGITDDDSFDIVRALVYPDEHELRWYCNRSLPTKWLPDGGETDVPQPPRPQMETEVPTSLVIVYNFKYKKWSFLDDTADYHIVGLVDGKPAGLFGWNFYKTSDTWSDAELCQWETPWIKVNQLQDFGRFYGATFVGKYLSSWTDNGAGVESGDLQVTVRYDYEGQGGQADVFRFRANKELGDTNGRRLQFKIRPPRQKCQAVKFEIEEVATTAIEVWEPTYAPGRGFVLTAVDIHYGAKGGSADKNLPAERKKG